MRVDGSTAAQVRGPSHAARASILWLAGGLALAACSGGKPVLLVDVTGDQAYDDVSLRLTTGSSLDKTFSHVTFGVAQVFRAGLILNGVTGAVTLLGEADNGQCILARGSVVVPDVDKVTGTVALTLTALAGCQPPQGRGNGDAAMDGDAPSGSGGNGSGGSDGGIATGGRAGGMGGGGLGGTVVGSGGTIGAGGGAGGMSGVAGHVGTGGAGTGGSGTGGSGAGGAGTGGSGTGGAGTGGSGAGGAGTGGRNCTGDLSNIGTGNFNIQFTITTSTTNGAVLNQRSICYTDEMWDIRTTSNGDLQVETDDNNGTYTAIVAPVVVADGNPHAVVVTRLNGTLMIMVDGVEVANGPSTSNLTALHALATKTDICDTTGGTAGLGDGTVPLVGTVTGVCIL